MFYHSKHVAAQTAEGNIQLSFSGKRLLRSVVSMLLAITMLFSSIFVSQAESASYALDDPELLPKLEEHLASNLQKQFGKNAKVESVQAVYVSKEYLEELEYNSQANIFFGHTLEELNAMFEGTRYVFALGEDGSTIVSGADSCGADRCGHRRRAGSCHGLCGGLCGIKGVSCHCAVLCLRKEPGRCWCSFRIVGERHHRAG